jgi:hypothetical protein
LPKKGIKKSPHRKAVPTFIFHQYLFPGIKQYASVKKTDAGNKNSFIYSNINPKA